MATSITTEAGNISTAATLEAAEKALDVVGEKVGEIIPETVKTVNLVKNNPYVIAGAAVIGLGTGLFVGYQLAKRHLEPKYAAIAEAEIEEAREHYQKLTKKAEFPTVADAASALLPDAENAFQAYRGHKVVEIEEDEHGLRVKTTLDSEVPAEPEIKKSNVFIDNLPINPDDWDYEREEEQRVGDAPYIIHEDEFNENEPDYSDTALTFFAKDRVLIDEETQEVVEDVEDIVGERNLHKFGHGAKSPNMLFVRNPKHGLNIEITRSSGSYVRDVLGMDDEDDEAPTPRKRRRAGDDDE